MTPEQLCDFADRLDRIAKSLDMLACEDIQRVADFLRQRAERQPSEQPSSGWKLVPVEPTAEMLSATSWPGCARADYAHMLAAAPAPQTATVKDSLTTEPTAQREPLSDEQIISIEKQASARYDANGRLVRWAVVFARAVERAHGITAKE